MSATRFRIWECGLRNCNWVFLRLILCNPKSEIRNWVAALLQIFGNSLPNLKTTLLIDQKEVNICIFLPIVWKKSLTVHLILNNYSVKRFLNSKNVWCHPRIRKPNPWNPLAGAVLREKWRLSTRRSETTSMAESIVLVGYFGWEIDLPSLLPGNVTSLWRPLCPTALPLIKDWFVQE